MPMCSGRIISLTVQGGKLEEQSWWGGAKRATTTSPNSWHSSTLLHVDLNNHSFFHDIAQDNFSSTPKLYVRNTTVLICMNLRSNDHVASQSFDHQATAREQVQYAFCSQMLTRFREIDILPPSWVTTGSRARVSTIEYKCHAVQ
jgi:hypothetical protein